MSIRVGFVNDPAFISSCGFHSPPCEKGGPFLELLFYIVRKCALKEASRDAEIQIIPVDYYSDIGNSSIIGGLANGYLDISPSYMTLTAERAERIPNLYPLYHNRFAFIYKKVNVQRPNLALFTASQSHVWAFIMLLWIWISLPKLAKFLFSYRSAFLDRYLTRQNLVLVFCFGVFLKFISTQLVILFADIRNPKEPFTTTEELIEKLENEQYRAVVTYELSRTFFVNPTGFEGKSSYYDRLIRAHEHNPSELRDTTEKAMDLVLNSTENFVLVIESMVLFHIRSHYCEISIVEDNLMPVLWMTVYKRHGFEFQLMSGSRILIELEYHRVHNEYFPPKRCPNEEESVGPMILSLYQLQSVFWVLGGGIVGGLCVLFLEKLVKLLM